METPNSPQGFDGTKGDLNDLKQTATDAARDLGSTASVHAAKAKEQLSSLRSHFQEEAADQLNQVRTSFNDVLQSGRDYVAAQPAKSLGIAVGIGIIIGFLARPGCSRSRDYIDN